MHRCIQAYRKLTMLWFQLIQTLSICPCTYLLMSTPCNIHHCTNVIIPWFTQPAIHEWIDSNFANAHYQNLHSPQQRAQLGLLNTGGILFLQFIHSWENHGIKTFMINITDRTGSQFSRLLSQARGFVSHESNVLMQLQKVGQTGWWRFCSRDEMYYVITHSIRKFLTNIFNYNIISTLSIILSSRRALERDNNCIHAYKM